MSKQGNKRERMLEIIDRDGPGCVWCCYPLFPGDPDLTTEHLVPKIKGGPSWLENEVAACSRCNRERRAMAPVTWIDKCQRRGLEPRVDVIQTCLYNLEEMIQIRGGQRKARPYLKSQLRRLEKLNN